MSETRIVKETYEICRACLGVGSRQRYESPEFTSTYPSEVVCRVCGGSGRILTSRTFEDRKESSR
jgi:DnaJ-class molecular chaperone